MDRNLVHYQRLVPYKPVATREGGVDRNYHNRWLLSTTLRSPPARVAWIETIPGNTYLKASGVATREGGVDRNTIQSGTLRLHPQSPPARVAWIETLYRPVRLTAKPSPPARVAWIETPGILPRHIKRQSPPARVAWIETLYYATPLHFKASPPARVAWIETQVRQPVPDICIVATREGGVDRNHVPIEKIKKGNPSPPARVAWIETLVAAASMP